MATGMVISFFFSEHLLRFLAQPLLDVLPEGQRHLQFTGLPEVFIVYLKVAFIGGIVLMMPVLRSSMAQQYETFKDRALTHSGVESVTALEEILGSK